MRQDWRVHGMWLLGLLVFLLVLFMWEKGKEPHEHIFLLRKNRIEPSSVLITTCRRRNTLHRISVDATDVRFNDTFIFPSAKQVISDQFAKCSKIVLDTNAYLRFQFEDEPLLHASVTAATNTFCNALPLVRVTHSNGCEVIPLQRIDISLVRSLNITNNTVDAYALEMLPHQLSITAVSISGVHAALASLYQILVSPKATYLPLTIRDDATHAWRGLMIDVARHYIPVSLLERTIHAMWYCPHVIFCFTYQQSFPLLLKDTNDYPLSLLARRGAHRSDMIYTVSDMKRLIYFAAQRGITIIPEIDVPAHTWSWAKAFPNIIINCTKTATAAQTPSNIYMLDITRNNTLSIVGAVLKAVAEVFPTKYMHVGGDEVSMECLRESNDVNDRLWKQNITHAQALEQFEAAVHKIVHSLDKIPIVWQGILDEQIVNQPKVQNTSYAQTILEPWKCWGGLATRSALFGLEHDYPVVNAACYYLDFNSDLSEYLAVKPYASNNPQRAAPNVSYRLASGMLVGDGVVGGEAAVWTEHIDASNFECRVWPRAVAIASAFWSGTAYVESIEDYRYLLASYTRFRYLLSDYARMQPSPITFHIHNDNGALVSPQTYYNENTTTTFIQSITQFQKSPRDGSLIIPLSSQCSGISQSTIRPWRSDILKISQLNIADGAFGSRGMLVDDWLQTQASQGVRIIGLCEANGWHTLSSTSPSDLSKNFPLIRSRAASVGFAFSHVMHSSEHPYNVGIVAAMPFTVVEEILPPLMQRGALHAYFERLQLHVFVAHLHAHDSRARAEEIKVLLSKLQPLLQAKSRVVLMGDLNTLSPIDRGQHDLLNLTAMLHRNDNAVFTRLRKKFVHPTSQNLDYDPIELLQDAGLRDVCVVKCAALSRQNINHVELLLWSDEIDSDYSVCMRQFCRKTEPTKFNPEWPFSLPPQPDMRLDFIFLSEALYNTNKVDFAIADISSTTDIMSDHYPMSVGVKWEYNVTFW